VVVGLAVLGGAEVILDPLGLSALRAYIVILVLLGFPIALVLAWAYEVRPEQPREAEPTTTATGGLAETRGKTSIVDLPFDNLSPDPGDAYFSDGLTEEIITNLSHLRPLRVISRNSAMALKGSQKDTRTIAGELGVQYVLEGSVRKAGDDLRITAQLINATADEHLWAETYDGKLEDVFDMQEQVSRSIVRALELQLTPDERAQIGARRIDNIPAYECFLKANGEILRFTTDALDRAVRHLEDAIEIIGPNTYLYAGMAFAHWQRVNMGVAQDEAIELAEEYVSRALELDPDFPAALAIRGTIEGGYRADLRRGVRSLRRALSANPDETLAVAFLAVFLVHLAGRPEAARPLVEHLAEIDPLNYVTHWLQGALFFFQGEHRSASVAWRRLHEMAAGSPMYAFYYALALAYDGDCGAALQVLQVPEPAEAENVGSRLCRMLGCALLNDKEGLLAEITPEFRRTAARDGTWAQHVAADLALVGAKEEALEWLGYAVDAGFINYPMLAEHDPFLANLRGEPQFESLAERVRHEWENFEA
jgi:TolB-like protein